MTITKQQTDAWAADVDYWRKKYADLGLQYDLLQQRIKEKSEQVPLTDEQCDKVLQRIDEWATGYGAQEYGLPLFWMPNRARDVLREALGEKA